LEEEVVVHTTLPGGRDHRKTSTPKVLIISILSIPVLFLAGLIVFRILSEDEISNIKAHFAKELPQDWQLASFRVMAKEDVGSEVDPQIHYRFIAEVSPKHDLYDKVGTLFETDILKINQKKDQKNTVHGTARSLFRAGEWTSFFELETTPFYGVGKPATAFAGKQVVQGSSHYRRLLKTAKSELASLEKQIQADEKLLVQGMADYAQLTQQLLEKARLSNEHVVNLEQQIQQQRQQIQHEISAQNRNLQAKQQAERQRKSAEFKQQLDVKVAELEKENRLKIAEFNAERTRARQAQTEERAKARNAYNADIKAARKRLDPAAFITSKAKAYEKLRADNQAIEAQYKQRVDQIKARETEQANYRRGQLDEYKAAYRKQVDEVNQQLTAEMNTARGAMNQRQQEVFAKLTAELTTARNKHQELLRNNSRQLNDKRADLDQLQRKLFSNKNLFDNSSRLLAALESDRR
jgi:DNA repair exonuclease SbcCD ATPase subunit